MKPLVDELREARRKDDAEYMAREGYRIHTGQVAYDHADEIERALEWWEKNEADDSLLFRAVKRIERLTQIIGDGQLDRIAALEEQLRLQHDSNCVFQPGPGKWFCATRCNVQGSRKAREVLDGHLQERQDDH